MFLATPHKGSALAQTLNNIIKATPGGSAKTYVAELERNSSSLQDINEQFRNICADLELVSLHETIKTSIGAGIKRMVGAHSIVYLIQLYNDSDLNRLWTRILPF